MLTRLKVQGFKNLIDIDVHFGPFTCIAGPNGVGKSNLFDAMLFLSELADKPFVEAASNTRGGDSPRGLFSAHGTQRMLLIAEMLIPGQGEDEFGQRAEASATFVRYELRLSLQPTSDSRLRDRIQLERESLSYITKREAKKRLVFPDTTGDWRASVVRKSSRTKPFISTDTVKGVVNLHADRMQDSEKTRRGGGKPAGFLAATLPRTVLSSAQNAEETRTAVLVRKEMRSWRLLQLEPSAMREPDDFQNEELLAATGAHIPATLYRLATSPGNAEHEGRVLSSMANRLAELVEGVRSIRVDRDDSRKVLTLMMKDRYGLELPASALSDGTMRFIALTVLQQDPLETGLICLEEPENGIHPERIGAMLRLLNDIVVETETVVDHDNPLRQIIINTHSPVVARLVGEGDLLFASLRAKRTKQGRIREFRLACLDSTWRSARGTDTIAKGRILSYLRGAPDIDQESRTRRVVDRFHPGQLDISSVT